MHEVLEDDEDQGGAAIEVVRLCPYCLTPDAIKRGADEPECRHCGTDVSSGQLITMEKGVWAERPRTACLSCGETILRGALVCSSCRAFIPGASPPD